MKSSVIYPGQEISKAILVRMEIVVLQLSQETGIKGDNREKKCKHIVPIVRNKVIGVKIKLHVL